MNERERIEELVNEACAEFGDSETPVTQCLKLMFMAMGIEEDEAIEKADNISEKYLLIKHGPEPKKINRKKLLATNLKEIVSDAIVAGSELQIHEDIKPLFEEYFKKIDKALEVL